MLDLDLLKLTPALLTHLDESKQTFSGWRLCAYSIVQWCPSVPAGRLVRAGELARPVHWIRGMIMSDKDYRSAKSGQYVTKSYANSHKSTTVAEKRDAPTNKGKGGKGK